MPQPGIEIIRSGEFTASGQPCRQVGGNRNGALLAGFADVFGYNYLLRSKSTAAQVRLLASAERVPVKAQMAK